MTPVAFVEGGIGHSNPLGDLPINEKSNDSPIAPPTASNKASWLTATLLAIPVAGVTFIGIVFLSLLLTPLFSVARMATNSNSIGYITFAFSPLAVLVPAAIHLRLALLNTPPIPVVAIGVVAGATAALLFNLPGGVWMFIDIDWYWTAPVA